PGEPWRSEIPEPLLRRALVAAGLRGATVAAFSVAERDSSGRALQVRAAGMSPERLDANAFRTAAGRTLGWQVVKSTMFDVARSAAGYVLTGKGLGHGVGLCVRGATARASRGVTRDAILGAYFPGLTIGRLSPAPSTGATVIRVLLPESQRPLLAETRERAQRVVRRVATTLSVGEPSGLEMRFHPTVEAYARATGLPWWTAARTLGTRIDLIPLDALKSRGILESTLAHEVVHVVADPVLRTQPLWVREGLAVAIAEGQTLGGAAAVRPATPAEACPTDAELRDRASEAAWRRAYRAAGTCVARALASGVRWQDLR
ncbi:MAG: hypothetical protein NTY02_15330, partial [Acidobacteria bacterium]|nr:hypothetical protein [Acidobacteriota bacterium]